MGSLPIYENYNIWSLRKVHDLTTCFSFMSVAQTVWQQLCTSLILSILLDNSTVVSDTKLTPTGVDESGKKEIFQQCCGLLLFLLLRVIFLVWGLNKKPSTPEMRFWPRWNPLEGGFDPPERDFGAILIVIIPWNTIELILAVIGLILSSSRAWICYTNLATLVFNYPYYCRNSLFTGAFESHD